MKPIYRILGALICLYWLYGLIFLFIGLIEKKPLFFDFIWILPLGSYSLLLIAPYIFYGYYPKWSQKILPNWLMKSMKADYYKNFNTKIKDLPDDEK